MDVLIDTNILVRLAVEGDPLAVPIRQTFADLQRKGARLCICNQNLYEFWVVATRPPESNGLGLQIETCQRAIATLVDSLIVLPDPPDLFDQWFALCVKNRIAGKAAHDARLAALMTCYKISTLVTFNDSDFRSFRDIQCIVPS
ncbi:MAG: type II toxin-antitoxin system VapC family toxin [Candidatus Sumerlaeaceae bacterium]|nr:type II toxin-antitoxin system VapC family toxin [Candidatus Sumerlaeaceae bacterium]